jgi:hypothetical protein
VDGPKLASASNMTAINMPVIYVIDSSCFCFCMHTIKQSILLSKWATDAQSFIRTATVPEAKEPLATCSQLAFTRRYYARERGQ